MDETVGDLLVRPRDELGQEQVAEELLRGGLMVEDCMTPGQFRRLVSGPR